jgi:hypothetical protein
MTKQLAYLAYFLLAGEIILAQTVPGKLQFEQGKALNVQMEMKALVTQQAGGQAIDFTADASALHIYKVIGHTKDDNTMLHHEIKKLKFNFDGMGQKRSFDSDNSSDMDGFFGATVKDILNKKFDIMINPYGKTLAVKPEKTDSIKADERLAIVFNMLKDITNAVYPPKKGEASFFKILPDKETGKGASWADSLQNETGKFKTMYTLTGITDSSIVIELKGNSVNTSKAMMMGRETTTTMSSSHSGKIILDKLTGIIREKTIVTESNGNTEAMGGTMPVTSRTTITIYVKQE